MRYFLDTNIFLRTILGDDSKKAKRCSTLFDKIYQGQIEATTSDLVLIEIVWILEGLKIKKPEISKRINGILQSGIVLFGRLDGSAMYEVVSIYSKLNVDFVDGYNAVLCKENGIVTQDSVI